MRSNNLGNKPWIVIVGLIASLLTLFSFLTGIFTIREIFPGYDNNGESQPSPKQNQYSVTEPPYQEVTPDLDIAESSDSTPSGDNLYITFLAGGEPITGDHLDFQILPATKDIAGNWTALDGYETYTPDLNGMISASFPPGDYALTFSDDNYYHSALGGSWGNVIGRKTNGERKQLYVFSINPGEITSIELPLAVLEVGLISKSGEALREKYIKVSCQVTDVAGKKIPAEFDSGCTYIAGHTDATGLIRFVLGAGTYVIYVSDDYPQGEITDKIYKYDVILSPSDVKRIIINIP